jgi:hypothetical protein
VTVEHDPAKTAPAAGPEDKPVPLWQKVAGVVFVIVWAAIVTLWHARALDDFYPLDASRVAPNLVASFILFSLGTIAGAVLWPPTRHAIHRFADRKLAPVHEHLAVIRQHHEESARRQEHLICQNAHIIANSKMPNETEDGIDLTKPLEEL